MPGQIQILNPIPIAEAAESCESMDALDAVFDPLRDFAKDSVRLVKRCHKPDRKGTFVLLPISHFLPDQWLKLDLFVWVEFSKVAVRTAIGFVVMGFVGFFVKLIFIPINNIIVGSAWFLDSGNFSFYLYIYICFAFFVLRCLCTWVSWKDEADDPMLLIYSLVFLVDAQFNQLLVVYSAHTCLIITYWIRNLCITCHFD